MTRKPANQTSGGMAFGVFLIIAGSVLALVCCVCVFAGMLR